MADEEVIDSCEPHIENGIVVQDYALIIWLDVRPVTKSIVQTQYIVGNVEQGYKYSWNGHLENIKIMKKFSNI